MAIGGRQAHRLVVDRHGPRTRALNNSLYDPWVKRCSPSDGYSVYVTVTLSVIVSEPVSTGVGATARPGTATPVCA